MPPTIILASQSQGRKKLLEYLKIPFQILPSSVNEEKINGSSPKQTLRLRAQTKGINVANSPKLLKLLRKPTTHNQQLTTIILSADSGAVIDGKLIGKPSDEKNALRIFRLLSGRTHEFVTATFIIQITFNIIHLTKSRKPEKGSFPRSREKFPQIASGSFRALNNHHQEFDADHITWIKTLGESADIVDQGNFSYKLESRRKILLDDLTSSFVTFRKLSDNDIRRYIKVTDYTRYAGGYAVCSAQDFITNIKGSISNVIGLPLEKLCRLSFRE